MPSPFFNCRHVQVYLARHKQTEQCYAIKVLQKNAIVRRNEVKHIMAERNVLLQNVTHPFLVGLHYSFQTSSKLYFVLDYVNGGELFFHLQRERVFEEPRARWVWSVGMATRQFSAVASFSYFYSRSRVAGKDFASDVL